MDHFVGRKEIIKEIEGFIYGGGRVALITGDHLIGKTELLMELDRRFKDEPHRPAAFYRLESKAEVFLPFLRAAAILMNALIVRGREQQAEDKSAKFFKEIVSKEYLCAAGVAVGQQLAGLIKADKVAEAIRGAIKKASQKVSISKSLDVMIVDLERPAMEVFRELLNRLAGIARPEDKLILMLDQVEKGGDKFRQLLGEVAVNLPVPVCLIVGVNTEMESGRNIFRDIEPEVKAKWHKQYVKHKLPGLTVDEIDDLVRARKEIELERHFLIQVKRRSHGVPGFIIPWIDSDDFANKRIEALDEHKTMLDGYYEQMIGALDLDSRRVAEAMSLISQPLPGGLKDIGDIFKKDEDWARAQEDKLVRAGVFRRFAGQDDAWFAHELLNEYVRNRWDPENQRDRKKHAQAIRQLLDAKCGDRLDVEVDPAFFTDYVSLLEWAGTADERGQKNIKLGQYYYRVAEYDAARACFENALVAAEEDGNRESIGICYSDIGLIHKVRGDYEQALEWYQKSVLIYKEIGEHKGLSIIYNNIGLIYDTRGKHDDALEWYKKSVDIKKDIGYTAGLAVTYNNIASIHFDRREYDQALEWFDKSLGIKESISNRLGLAKTYSNIGMTHGERGEYDQAMEWYQKSVEIQKEIGDRAGLATTYNNIGGIHDSCGEFDKAMEWYQKSLQIREEIGHRAGLASTLHNIGAVWFEQDQIPQAAAHFQAALNIFQSLGPNPNTSKVEEWIADTVEKLGPDAHAEAIKLENAPEYLRKYL